MARKLCEVSTYQILERIKSKGWSSAPDIHATFDQGRKAALKRLQRLENLGLVKVTGTISTCRNTLGATAVYELVDKNADIDELKTASRGKPSKTQSRPTTTPSVSHGFLFAWGLKGVTNSNSK